MLYSSEGLMSACGLVPSVFGRAYSVLTSNAKSIPVYTVLKEFRA